MNIDILTAGTALFSFVVFLSVHFIAFRWVKPERLLKSLMMYVIAIMVLPALLMAGFFICRGVDETPLAWVCAAVMASVIQGLLCFVYVLCVFGPYETSVRMRLVREIAGGGSDGISREQLLARYNAETIVNIRLQRLIGSGDVVEKDGRYRVKNSRNLFFIFDAISAVLKGWIGR